MHQKTEDEEVTIGLGGGRNGRKGRNEKKKKQKKKGEEEGAEGQIPGLENGAGGLGGGGGPGGVGATGHEEGPPFELEADPNEPRYCTCNRVSFGQVSGSSLRRFSTQPERPRWRVVKSTHLRSPGMRFAS